MSFTWKADRPLLTEEQIARAVHEVSLSRGLDELASVITLMGIRQESAFWCPANDNDPTSKNYPHDSLSDDGRSVAYLQQQNGVAGEIPPPDQDWWGPMSCRMDLKCSVNTFQERLSDDYTTANDAATAGQFVQRVQGSAYPDAYAQHWDYCWDLLHRALAGNDDDPAAPAGPTPVTAAPAEDPRLVALRKVRPDFNEYPNWSDNSQPRPGNPVDVVDLFLDHTEEGDMNADALVTWMKDNGVSYHYAGSQDPRDGGVTVVDMIDTDLASWSVMNSNGRSINFCYAGSYTSWTRDEWMAKAGKVIDVAAYLSVQDAIKYPGIGNPPKVLIPYSDPPGIADHRYCSVYLKDGNNHTDVGDNFPWDYRAERVAFYWAAANNIDAEEPADSGDDAPTPVPQLPTGDAALKVIMEQQLGPWDAATGRFTGWPQLSGDPEALKVLQAKVDAGVPLSLVDGVAATRFNLTPSSTAKKVCAPAAPAKKAPAKKAPARKRPAKKAAPKKASG